ncbi:MAG: histone deacetylase family protein [Pseudomonadales bacterium]
MALRFATLIAMVNKTALITHPDCALHALSGHPERPERLTAVIKQLEDSGLLDELVNCEASEISREQLERVHPAGFVDAIESAEVAGGVTRIDADTYLSPGSNLAARLAAGACAMAANMVASGEVNRAFCATRPPGHHAELSQAMGFCLYNNVAVGATTALARNDVNKVAILDFDVHHCNGTVDIFKDNDQVLVCSSFQKDFYPYRYLDYANPHIVITPLAAGTGSDEFKRRIAADWPRAIAAHKPDLIFVSAGFDAHKDDPVGGLALVTEDYRWITQLIGSLARQYAAGRIVSTLEGGYDLSALAGGVQAHVEALIES